MKQLNTPLMVLACILAVYGLIILIRKIMNRDNDKGEFKGLKYFVEPYSATGCSCKKSGFLNLSKTCDCCNIDKKKLLSGTSMSDAERRTLQLCPDYLEACKAHIMSKTGQIPANIATVCLNPSTAAEVAKTMF